MKNNFEEETPIIIGGMHRSGTSILTDLVQAMGVFVGKKRGAHNEDQLFVYLNDWILKEYDSNWANPYLLNAAIESDEKNEMVASHIQDILKWNLNFKFFGFINLIKKSLDSEGFLYSFKDPCFSILTPVWTRIFPKARYIFILRDGIDVSLSLQKRQIDYFQKNKKRYKDHPFFKYYLLYRQHFIKKNRVKAFCNNSSAEQIDRSLVLWDYYNQAILKFVQNLEPDRYLYIRYEDLLKMPAQNVKLLGDFIFPHGIEASKIEEIVDLLQLDKAKKSKESQIVYEARLRNNHILKKYGY